MSLFITLLYILMAYLSPDTIFGDLAQFHLELIVAFVALLLTALAFPRGLFKQPQMLAILGMMAGVFISLLLTGWFTAAPVGIWAFLPNVFVYVLIVAHCKTKGHLQWVIAGLFFSSAYIILRGAMALSQNEIDSAFLMKQGVGGENYILRLRGLSIIGDPNDFAQVLVALTPCLFFFWKPKKLFWNLVVVVPAVAVLVCGIYLTHSRGAIMALTAMMVVAVYRRFGAVFAAPVGAGVFLLATGLSMSGGRDISVESGSDRLDAWAAGLDLIKSHPIFGVGFERFAENYPITAHNSIVVCCAELGLFGFFFWVLLVFTSIRNAAVLSRKEKEEPKEESSRPPSYAARYLSTSKKAAAIGSSAQQESSVAVLDPPVRGPFSQREEPLPREEIRRLAGLMVISLTGFLVAGWFLSRAFVMWLFIFCGIAQVLVQIAEKQGMPFKEMKISSLLKWAFCISLALLMLVSVILRVRNVVG